MAAKKCLICNCPFSGRRDAKTCSARCRKRLQLVKLSFVTAPARRELTKMLPGVIFGIIGVLSIFLSLSPSLATAATSDNLNFQARLLTSTGSVVADGNYHIEFKIYDSASAGASAQGVCSLNSSTDDCWWLETRTTGNLVRVVNGYFSVNLGSVTGFGANVPWDQPLWLTMNIGGSGGSPSWDSEMLASGNRIKLTGVPYAFRAGSIAKNNGTQTGTLSFNTVANSPVITLPDASGTICLQSAAACGFALGTTASYIQNGTSLQTSANFNIQSAASGSIGAIINGAAGQSVDTFQVKANAVANPLFSIASAGAATFRNSTDSTTAFQVQNAAGGSLLNVDSTNGGNLSLLGNNSGEITGWTGNSNQLPAARYNIASVEANGYIYSVGGYNVTSQNNVYYAEVNMDGSVGVFTTSSNPLPAVRSDHGLVVANRYLYVVGGSSNGTNAQSTIYYSQLNSDGANGSWQTNSFSLPEGRRSAGVISANGYIYVVGGNDGTNTESTVFYAKLNADGSTGAWTTSANSLPAVRQDVGIASTNGYLYLLGGTNNGASSQNDVYRARLNSDGTTTSWTSTTSLPSVNSWLGAAVANGYIYTFGGSGANGTATHYAKINANGTIGTWATSATSSSGVRQSYGQLLMVNGYLYAIGGWNGSAPQSTVYYATTPRVTIGGSLDLVGLSGEKLSAGGGGTLTAGNTKIIGVLNVQDSATVGGSLSVRGGLTVNEDVLFKNTTNSASAFQVQNALGSSVLSLDTTPLNAILTNSSFEGSDISAWTYLGTPGSVSRTTTEKYIGNASFQVVTTANANNGIKYVTGNGATALATSTTYTFSWVDKLSSGSFTDIIAAYARDGSTETNCTALSDSTVSTAGWYRRFCTITTDGTAPAASAYIAIKQTAGTARTFYIDAVQIEVGSTVTAYREAAISLNGLISSPVIFKNQSNSNTAFQVQNASGNVLLYINTLGNGSVSVGDTGLATDVRLGNSAGVVSQTINIGTNTTSGSNTNVNIGTNTGSFATTIKSGNNITLTAPNTFVIPNSDSTTSFRLQSATSTVNSVNYNSSSGQLSVLGAGALGGWSQSLNSLPATRRAASVASSGSHYYVFGGDNGSNETPVTSVYHAKLNSAGGTDTWQTSGNSLPGAIRRGGGTAYNGFIYSIGGRNGDDTSGTTVGTVYYAPLDANGSVGTWVTNGTSLPSGRMDFRPVAYNGYMYVTGGRDNSFVRTATVYYAPINADGSIGAWSTTTALPSARSGEITAAGSNGYLYVVGGVPTSGGSATNTTYYALLNSNGTISSWSTSTTLPATRTPNVVNYGGTLYALGGSDNSGTSMTTSYYSTASSNGSTSSWLTASDFLPTTNLTGAESSSNGYVYMLLDNGTSVYSASLFPNSTVTGQTVLQSFSNSSYAFQVQNAIGSNALLVDTTSLNSILTNSNFEGSDVSAWTYLGTPGSVSKDTSQSYLGSSALKVTTTANTNNGVKYVTGNGNSALAISTTYTISWYTKLDAASAAFTDAIATYARDGTTQTNCTGINTQTVFTTGWTRHTCQIVTDATSPASTAFVAIKQAGATAHTFYIDAIQIEAASSASPYKESGISLNGVISSPVAFKNRSDSTLAFQIQNAAGTSNLFVADTLNGRVGIGTASPGGKLTVVNNGVNGIQLLGGNATGDADLVIGRNTTADGRISVAGVAGNFDDAAAAGDLILRTEGGSLRVNTASGTGTSALTVLGGNGNVGIGITAPAAKLHVSSGGTDPLFRVTDTTATARDVLNIADGGAATFKNQTNSTTAFQIQNAAGTSNLFVADTISNRIGIGTNAPAATIHVVGSTFIDNSGSNHVLSGNPGLTVDGAASEDIARFRDVGANLALVVDSAGRVGIGANPTPTALLDVRGDALFKNVANSTTAFQIQNAAAANILNVDTSTSLNLATNGDIETATTGWTAKGSSTLTKVTTQQWQGNSSLQTATTTAANDGAKYNYTFGATTQYSLSLYAKVASGSITDVNIGRQDNGSDINCLTGQTLNTNWTRFSCTFTTGGTISGSNIYIKKTGVVAETFFIDGIQLQAGASTTAFNAGGALQFSGIVNSPVTFQNKSDSTTAFQIQNAAGTSKLFVADTSNSKINIDGDVNVGTGYGKRILSDGFESGSAANWDPYDGNGNPAGITNGIVHSGGFAGVIAPDGGNISRLQYTYGSAGGTGYTTYARVWVYVDSQSSSELRLMSFGQGNSAEEWSLYRNSSSQLCLYNDFISSTETGSCGGSFTTGAWHKVEFRITIGTTTSNGTSQTWLDDTLVFNSSTRNNSTTAVSQMYSVRIGTKVNGENATAYFDDFSADADTQVSTSKSLSVDESLAVNGGTSLNGPTVIRPKYVASSAFKVQSPNGANHLNVDTVNSSVTINMGNLAGSNSFVVGNGSGGTLFNLNSVNDLATINGSATFTTATNSTTGFQVQSAAAANILNIDTLTSLNLVTNGDQEIPDTFSWTAKGNSILTKVTTQQWQGNLSLQTATTTTANDGAQYDFTFGATTQYTLSLYAKVSSGSITDVNIGRQDNGSDIDCLTGQTLSTNWTRFSCTFTTGATISGSNIYIKKTGVAAETFFIDGLQLQAGAAATAFNAGGALQFSGIVNSPVTFQNKSNSTTAFQIQNAAGTTLLGIDTVNSSIFSSIANGASAIGFTLNTPSYTTAGAKLISIQNNATEKFAIDKDGNIFVVSGSALAFQGVGQTKNVITKKFICTADTSAGDVVVVDTANAGQLTTLGTADSPLVAGVVSVGAGAGGTCEVAVSGVIQATMTTAGAVAVGDRLATSATAGQGQTNNTPAISTVFGKALSAKAGATAGSVWILLALN